MSPFYPDVQPYFQLAMSRGGLDMSPEAGGNLQVRQRLLACHAAKHTLAKPMPTRLLKCAHHAHLLLSLVPLVQAMEREVNVYHRELIDSASPYDAALLLSLQLRRLQVGVCRSCCRVLQPAGQRAPPLNRLLFLDVL